MGWPLPHPAASSNQAWRRFQPPFRPSWIMASETQMREGDQTQTGCTVHRDLGHCGSQVQQHSREFSDSHTRKYTAVVVSSVCGNKTSLLFFADPITRNQPTSTSSIAEGMSVTN